MSTKAIREALRRWRATMALGERDNIAVHDAAMEQVKAVERMARENCGCCASDEAETTRMAIAEETRIRG